jgi:hypothetical protein
LRRLLLRFRLPALVLLLAVASPAAAQDLLGVDFGTTLPGGDVGPWPGPQPAGGFCDGVNHENDSHFDPAFMGGPMVGWEWGPAATATIGRIEIFTGEVSASSRLALWSDDGGAPGRPLASLGWSAPFAVDVAKAWVGADLLVPVDVTGGAIYWVVWDPQGNEQVSASDDPADTRMNYYGSSAGDVEGGAAWSGPFNFTDRRWKARMTCVDACLEPFLFSGTTEDVGPCLDGIRLSWEPADFPDVAAGVYHVYRSLIGFADALLRPTVAQNLTEMSWVDTDTLPGELWHHVVQAESTDFPGCGDGPSVGGSTDTLELGPTEDFADLVPPDNVVGNTLRVTGYTPDTADLEWPLGPAPGPDEHYALFRSDDAPGGLFQVISTTRVQLFTDPAATPSPARWHVFFYDLRLADDCGNVSAD